jgi:serine/threonine protein phosphatase PrpC
MGNLQFSTVSDIGFTRKVNQDSVGVIAPLGTDPKCGLFVVCDGMGAHKAGEVASQLAVDTIIQTYPTLILTWKATDALRQSVQRAHEKIIAMASNNEGMSDMGTTVVIAVADHNKLYIASVGDSRAYLLRDKRFIQLTTDHSQLNDLVQMGVLDETEKKNARRNALSRSLSALRATVQVDLFDEEFLEGDSVLLCSDGLWGQVSDKDIKNIITIYPIDKAVINLVKLANKAGGMDNVTVVIVHKGKLMPKSLNFWQRRFENPFISAALVGILVAFLTLLVIGLWLFR